MAYQVLARKYRPLRFADVKGQEHVTRTLMNALGQQRIAHGYIFSGHRGIGKTTIARILASALNCRRVIGSAERPSAEPCLECESCTEVRAGNSVDVLEIDAATNRGIDEIRELRDAARYRPARDKYKIIILDEAHQITDAAFNALLKTLEEPPEHIVFMMATTQPEDIPQTIRSRCQHFSFHAVKLDDIIAEIRGIAEREGVDADEAALGLLAEAGDGSMRDALSIMDQAIASAPHDDGRARLDAGQIRELMGAVPNAVFEQVLEAVSANHSADVITVANRLLDAGNSPSQLARQFVRYLRNCVVAKVAGITPENDATELLQISADERKRAARSAMLFSEEELTRFLQVMLRTFDELGYRQEQRFHFELGLLKLVHLQRLLPVEELLSQFPAGGRPAAASVPVRGTVSAAAPAAGSSSSARVSAVAAPVAAAKSSFSPFEADRNRKTTSEVVSGRTPVASVSAVAMESTAGALALATAVMPEMMTGPVAVAALEEMLEAEPVAVAEAVEVVRAAGVPEASVLQAGVVDALGAAKSQGSAADAMADAEWAIAGGELRVQTSVSKTMLGVLVNPEADKIVRAKLREMGAGALKLVFLPGAEAAAGAPKKAKAARSGSVQAKALEHPIVQQAQRLFNAEVRTVIDLREKE